VPLLVSWPVTVRENPEPSTLKISKVILIVCVGIGELVAVVVGTGFGTGVAILGVEDLVETAGTVEVTVLGEYAGVGLAAAEFRITCTKLLIKIAALIMMTIVNPRIRLIKSLLLFFILLLEFLLREKVITSIINYVRGVVSFFETGN
jgi:hypothetical protein